MKLNNQQILNASQGCTVLGSYELPTKLSFQQAKLKIMLDNLVKPINAARQKLITENSLQDENKNPKVKPNGDAEIDPAKLAAFNKAYQELMEIEQELDWKDKIKVPEKIPCICEKCRHNMDKPLVIPGNVLVALEPFIEA